MAAWINKRLANPPNIGIGAWRYYSNIYDDMFAWEITDF